LDQDIPVFDHRLALFYPLPLWICKYKRKQHDCLCQKS
jgi:hypothetical protein